jgi:hypothetical protein
MKDEQLLES